MPTENKKSCGLCSKYGALVNQGYWWCNAGHTENMNPETCGDYDGAYENTENKVSSTVSSYTLRAGELYRNPFTPKPMSMSKMKKARENRKKQRGIRHGRRN